MHISSNLLEGKILLNVINKPVKESESGSVVSNSLPPVDYSPWNSSGQNTGVGCHFLLQSMKVKSEREIARSRPILATPWTAAHQAPPSMGFPRQEYWSGVPLHDVNFC